MTKKKNYVTREDATATIEIMCAYFMMAFKVIRECQDRIIELEKRTAHLDKR